MGSQLSLDGKSDSFKSEFDSRIHDLDLPYEEKSRLLSQPISVKWELLCKYQNLCNKAVVTATDVIQRLQMLPISQELKFCRKWLLASQRSDLKTFVSLGGLDALVNILLLEDDASNSSSKKAEALLCLSRLMETEEAINVIRNDESAMLIFCLKLDPSADTICHNALNLIAQFAAYCPNSAEIIWPALRECLEELELPRETDIWLRVLAEGSIICKRDVLHTLMMIIGSCSTEASRAELLSKFEEGGLLGKVGSLREQYGQPNSLELIERANDEIVKARQSAQNPALRNLASIAKNTLVISLDSSGPKIFTTKRSSEDFEKEGDEREETLEEVFASLLSYLQLFWQLYYPPDLPAPSQEALPQLADVWGNAWQMAGQLDAERELTEALMVFVSRNSKGAWADCAARLKASESLEEEHADLKLQLSAEVKKVTDLSTQVKAMSGKSVASMKNIENLNKQVEVLTSELRAVKEQLDKERLKPTALQSNRPNDLPGSIQSSSVPPLPGMGPPPLPGMGLPPQLGRSAGPPPLPGMSTGPPPLPGMAPPTLPGMSAGPPLLPGMSTGPPPLPGMGPPALPGMSAGPPPLPGMGPPPLPGVGPSSLPGKGPPPLPGMGPPPLPGMAPPLPGQIPPAPGSSMIGQLPSKQKRAPLKPMKGLMWETVSPVQYNQSVWKEISDADIQLDVELLTEKFCQAKPAQEKAPSAQAPQVARIDIIPKKRCQPVEIILARLRIPSQTILSALLRMDEEVLTLRALESLKGTMPTDSEISKLTSFTGEPSELGAVEQYFLSLSEIPAPTERIDSLISKHYIGASLDFLNENIPTLRALYKEIISSRRLHGVMAVTLAVGNYMNGTGFRGGAYGFQISTLNKLSGMKGNDKSSLLDFIVLSCARTNPDLLNLKQDLPHLEPSMKLSLSDLKVELTALTKAHGTIRVAIDSQSESPDDHVAEKLGRHYQELSREVQDKEAATKQLEELFMEMHKAYCVDPKSEEGSNFLGDLNNFVNTFTQLSLPYLSEAQKQARQQTPQPKVSWGVIFKAESKPNADRVRLSAALMKKLIPQDEL
jgi:diaphanous 1